MILDEVIIIFTFCCDNLWKTKFMALEKPLGQKHAKISRSKKLLITCSLSICVLFVYVCSHTVILLS